MSVKSNKSTRIASRSRQSGRFLDREAVSGKGSEQSRMQYYRSCTAIRTAPVPYRTGRRV